MFTENDRNSGPMQENKSLQRLRCWIEKLNNCTWEDDHQAASNGAGGEAAMNVTILSMCANKCVY